MNENDIAVIAEDALRSGEIFPYYQPQYNQATGLLIGAEALARWKRPDGEFIPPSAFIPVFEEKGLITELDLLMFEAVCGFQKACLSEKLQLIPISVNVTRYDLDIPDFPDRLEAIREKYDVPAKYLRLEITESAAIRGVEKINAVIDRLHALGFLIEMDDFGSGYSSLNILKDLNVDIVKLDLEFVRNTSGRGRGSIILSSLVRMLHWLTLPIIAEGVETAEQASFMKSIGVDQIQGFFFSRPLDSDAFFELVRNGNISLHTETTRYIEHLDVNRFWDPASLDTLIFSTYTGAAAIFALSGDRYEILRVNEKYLRELGMNMEEKEFLTDALMNSMDEENQKLFLDTLKRAAETGEDEECETCRNIESDCCGEETIFIRTTVHMIGQNREETLFYATIRNITPEKQRTMELGAYEQKFKQVTEQVNIYYWEYTVATKEMRPCFRCMRDLGLPPVVKNYPEPAIEAGIFPADYADMYRDWHRQIEAGVKELEAIIPLTVGRVPFRVKYITEFDDYGRPVKAYGSATFVHEGE